MAQLSVLKTWLQARLNVSERGANLVEYILLIVFIALAVTLAIIGLKNAISDKFGSASNCLNTQPNGGC